MTAKLSRLLAIFIFTIADGFVLEQLGLRPALAIVAGAALAPFVSWAWEEMFARALSPRPKADDVAAVGGDDPSD